MSAPAGLITRLEQARAAATEAELEATEAERAARRLRRHANNLMGRYEKLLLESQGQLAIPIPGEESGSE